VSGPGGDAAAYPWRFWLEGEATVSAYRPGTVRRLLVEIYHGGAFVVKKFPVDRKKIDIGDYYADDRLIGRTLGWRPRTSVRAALTRTLAYYRKELRHYL
jgi:UDP-glucose 4-epimerase